VEKVAAGEDVGHQSPVTYRGALDDKQEAASRPKDFTLDPKYQGFIPIPNTPALIKFNAKPHLDLISDNKNAGNENRFVPASFPLKGTPSYGGGEQFNMNANATQLRLDVRAPELGGNFRFYYQNDFFGSGSDTGDMKYRVQHVYGQFYGFKAGFTYGVFEDPDSWPDTVDYEGPNAVLFSRRPVAQYTYAWSDNWNTTFGVEKPDIYIDVDSGPNAGGSSSARFRIWAFNTRYEQRASATCNSAPCSATWARRTAWVTSTMSSAGASTWRRPRYHQERLPAAARRLWPWRGRPGNDAGFLNSDAAFTAAGELEALPLLERHGGLTHRWNNSLRSTLTLAT
jgi:hypothetical protein